MLLLALLGLAPFLSFTLGLHLSLTNSGSERLPDSNVGITWTHSHSDPSTFTLRLVNPDAENSWESTETQPSGQVQMGVGRAGTYAVFATDSNNNILDTLSFDVEAASTAVSTAHTPSSSPVSTSPSPSPPETTLPTSESHTHTQDQTTETPDPSTSGSTVVNTTATDSTSPNGSMINSMSHSSQSDNTGSSSPHLPPALTNSPMPTYPPGDTNTSPAYPPIASSLPSTSPTSSEPPSSPSKRGTILGTVLGSLAFLIILAIIAFLLWRRRRQKQERRIIFHKDMMVRSPGPSLLALSQAASSGERRVNPIFGSMEQNLHVTEPLDATISDPPRTSQESVESEQYTASSRPSTMLTRRESDPFRDPEWMHHEGPVAAPSTSVSNLLPGPISGSVPLN